MLAELKAHVKGHEANVESLTSTLETKDQIINVSSLVLPPVPHGHEVRHSPALDKELLPSHDMGDPPSPPCSSSSSSQTCCSCLCEEFGVSLHVCLGRSCTCIWVSVGTDRPATVRARPPVGHRLGCPRGRAPPSAETASKR